MMLPPTVLSPVVLTTDPTTGATGPGTAHYAKRLSELEGVFADAQAFAQAVGDDPDRVVYEVFDYRPQERAGELILGTSVLQPGLVGREFHLTRGHLHRLADRSEVYHCLSGHGVMLMETLAGEVVAEELTPGRTVHVPGHWIHRSVNVGDEPFTTLFCYPADAGQDYDVIAAAGGMAELVVTDGAGGWRTEPNPAWRRRRDA